MSVFQYWFNFLFISVVGCFQTVPASKLNLLLDDGIVHRWICNNVVRVGAESICGVNVGIYTSNILMSNDIFCIIFLIFGVVDDNDIRTFCWLEISLNFNVVALSFVYEGCTTNGSIACSQGKYIFIRCFLSLLIFFSQRHCTTSCATAFSLQFFLSVIVVSYSVFPGNWFRYNGVGYLCCVFYIVFGFFVE